MKDEKIVCGFYQRRSSVMLSPSLCLFVIICLFAPAGAQQQQVHLDLHVDGLEEAQELARALGGRQLQAPQRPADNPDGDEVFVVYASPAGHPFCFGVH